MQAIINKYKKFKFYICCSYQIQKKMILKISLSDRMLQILGYKPNDLLDKSLYEYHHGADSEMLMNAFKNGKMSTVKY